MIQTTSRLRITPDNSVGLTTVICTGATTPDLGAFGSWVEFIASAAADTWIAGVTLSPAPPNAGIALVFQYGIGAAAAEVPLNDGHFIIDVAGGGNHYQNAHLLEVPIGPIAAGSRIAIRVKSSNTITSGAMAVTLLYYENLDSAHYSLQKQNYGPIDKRGGVLTPSGSAFGNSAWVELVASLVEDGAILGISINSPVAEVEQVWELGLGGAGSETAITAIRVSSSDASVGVGDFDLPAPYPIAAGSRVSARLRKTGTDTTTYFVTLRYIGFSQAIPIQKVTQQVLLVWYNAAASEPPPSDPCSGGGTVPAGTNPSAGENLSTSTAPIPWVAITIGATTYRYAAATIPHSPPRYGRVKSFGTVNRRLSEPDSGPRAATMSVQLIDTDRVLRGLANAGTLKHALVEAFVSDMATIIAEGAGFRVFCGRVAEWSADAGLTFSIVVEDELTARLTSIDAQDQQVGLSLFDDIADHQPEELAFGKPAPEVYGSVSDEDADEPKGVWQLSFTETRTFDEAPDLGNNYVFPISVGTVAQVQAVFGASPFEDPPVTRVKMPASAFGDWLWVTTMPGWFGPDDYYVDNTGNRRWTVLVAQQNRATSQMAREGRIPFTVNVCGYETVGDSSGNTINSIPRGFLHWMNNRLLQDVSTSDWATTIFALGDHSLIDTTTFEAVHGLLDDLDYVLGGVLGWDLQFESWRDRWALWLRHMGYDAATGYNRHGQVILVKLDRTDAYAGAPAFTEAQILERGCRVTNRDDAVENVIRYVSQQNYRTRLQGLNPPEGERGLRDPYDGPWLYLPPDLQDATSITALGGDPRGKRRSAIQEYGLTRDTATADALAQERLDWLKPANGRAEVDFDLSLRHAWDIELGDVITLAHHDLTWTTARRCQVRGVAWNLDTHVVTVTVWDVEDLLP